MLVLAISEQLVSETFRASFKMLNRILFKIFIRQNLSLFANNINFGDVDEFVLLTELSDCLKFIYGKRPGAGFIKET
uniref:Uncharacterized protein n=1 Tax=Romanomermis culicivorax TaxID=13658 RepID=A0A915JP71_ROMCU